MKLTQGKLTDENTNSRNVWDKYLYLLLSIPIFEVRTEQFLHDSRVSNKIPKSALEKLKIVENLPTNT